MTDVFEGSRPAGGPAMPAGPPVTDPAEWDLVSRGVRQRVRVLEAFLADVYGRRRAFDDGIVPWRLLYASGEFRREVAGFAPPNGVRCHVAGVDLARDERGRFRVRGHNVRDPDGVSDGIGITRARHDQFPSLLLSALRVAAPHGANVPFIVLLTPGEHDAAHAEHALLARRMGVELVEGRDLICRGNRVYTTRGQRPVHVIYRRVGDEWLDPVQFRPGSALGCPGLVNAARAGTVTIANGIGNGIADDPRLYPRIPDLIRYYLDEEPLLGNAVAQAGEKAGATLAPQHPGDLRLLAVNDGRDVRVLSGETTRERDGRA